MNNRGQQFFLGLMIGVVILIMALALAPVVSEITEDTRNVTTDSGAGGLDCSNTSISDFDKAACVSTDLTVFYFIGGLIFLAGLVITARIMLR